MLCVGWKYDKDILHVPLTFKTGNDKILCPKKIVGPLKYFILCSIIVQKTISRTHFENHYYNTAVAFQKIPDMFISPSLKARVQKF